MIILHNPTNGTHSTHKKTKAALIQDGLGWVSKTKEIENRPSLFHLLFKYKVVPTRHRVYEQSTQAAPPVNHLVQYDKKWLQTTP